MSWFESSDFLVDMVTQPPNLSGQAAERKYARLFAKNTLPTNPCWLSRKTRDILCPGTRTKIDSFVIDSQQWSHPVLCNRSSPWSLDEYSSWCYRRRLESENKIMRYSLHSFFTRGLSVFSHYKSSAPASLTAVLFHPLLKAQTCLMFWFM